MDVVPLIKRLTRTLVVAVFWLIMLLSMFLANSLTIPVLLFILVKSLLVSALLWIFLAISLDAIIKVMVADAHEKQVDRLDGGLSYHFAKPTIEEVMAQKESAETAPKAVKK